MRGNCGKCGNWGELEDLNNCESCNAEPSPSSMHCLELDWSKQILKLQPDLCVSLFWKEIDRYAEHANVTSAQQDTEILKEDLVLIEGEGIMLARLVPELVPVMERWSVFWVATTIEKEEV
jgi:hypothetical protein